MQCIKRSLLVATSVLSVASSNAMAAPITGAGSTFIYPLLSNWSADYKKADGDEINYQSIGSGGGIAQIKAATVDFGATDKPLDSRRARCCRPRQFPW